jgi:hypothetical protein
LATNARACSAASIISLIKRRSRRIEWSRVVQNLSPESRVDRPPRYEVDRPTEQGRQLIGEVVDLPAEASTWHCVVQQVEVAAGPVIAPGDGAEKKQDRDPVSAAEHIELIGVELDTPRCHDPSHPRCAMAASVPDQADARSGPELEPQTFLPSS